VAGCRISHKDPKDRTSCVEISVESVDGVRVAARAGAARVELCAGLSDGDLTPSAAPRWSDRAAAPAAARSCPSSVRPPFTWFTPAGRPLASGLDDDLGHMARR
jgi:hypothetical protein